MSDGWDQVLVVESLLDGEWYPWEFAKQRRENWTVYDDNPRFRFRRFVPEDASRASEAALQARVRELTAALEQGERLRAAVKEFVGCFGDGRHNCPTCITSSGHRGGCEYNALRAALHGQEPAADAE